MRKIVEDERARQGPKGRPVFLVLIGSFLLIGIYLLSMLVWSGSDSPVANLSAQRKSLSTWSAPMPTAS